MATQFRFPDVGEGIVEGTLLKWLVQEGDFVKQDQSLAEVETDKAVVELPSPATGIVLKLHVKAGEKINVGQVLVSIGEKGESIPASAPPAMLEKENSKTIPKKQSEKFEMENIAVKKLPMKTARQEELSEKMLVGEEAEPGALKELMEHVEFNPKKMMPASFASPEPADTLLPVGMIRAMPHTRKLARMLGVDIRKIAGSGPGGRITDEDIKRIKERKAVPAVSFVPTKQGGTTIEATQGREERIPLRGIRKAVAENVSRSFRTTVPVTVMDEADVEELWALREREKEKLKAHNVHLTFLPFAIKACLVALEKFPFFNASIDDATSEIVLKHYFHIGIAVDTEEGLMVPVIRNADKKSIVELAIEIQELAQSSRERKISLEDLKGSSFSITNYGSVGGKFGTPIINYPNVAVLGMGKIYEKPVVLDGKIVIRKVFPLSLTFDHRIVDGAQASQFLDEIMKHLEDPGLLLVDSL